jgi:hypothetical protein
MNIEDIQLYNSVQEKLKTLNLTLSTSRGNFEVIDNKGTSLCALETVEALKTYLIGYEIGYNLGKEIVKAQPKVKKSKIFRVGFSNEKPFNSRDGDYYFVLDPNDKKVVRFFYQNGQIRETTIWTYEAVMKEVKTGSYSKLKKQFILSNDPYPKS